MWARGVYINLCMSDFFSNFAPFFEESDEKLDYTLTICGALCEL